MKTVLRRVIGVFFIPAILLCARQGAQAQDPVKVDPDHYKVLYEDKSVRILEYNDSPGHKVPKHSHPSYFVYVVSDATRLFTQWKSGKDCTGGESKTVMLKADEHLPANPPPLNPAVTHCEENTGNTDTRLIVVEFKGNSAKTSQSPAATATAASSPAQIVIPPFPFSFPSPSPSGIPPAVVSGTVPYAVPLPATINTPLQIRPNFDYFSWESFIALNWPAAAGARGVPDQPDNPNVFLQARPGTPVVWGTYKDSFDLFGQQDKRPNAWDAPDGPMTPCGNASGQKTLIFTSKGNTPLMQTKQAFSYPLIDQRRNYVYYDIRYNQAEYDFIRGQDNDPSSWLYLLKNLAPKENAQFGVQMPMTTATPANQLGSIMVKAAWRIKTGKDDASRYYATTAQIYDPQAKTCTPATVLLVGLHIAHKISPFTEWVWSTFEQVDNVPPDSDISPKPSPPPKGYSFNNGKNNPPTVGGYNYKPSPSPSAPSPSPVQVTRVNAIPNTPPGASTRDFNAYYQQLLKGTVWQYYQLVVTQWPFNPGIGQDGPFMLMQNGGVYPQNAGSAFPVDGAVNTTMETYFQAQNDAAGAGGNSCMSCHYRAGQSDFSWGLNRRAH